MRSAVDLIGAAICIVMDIDQTVAMHVVVNIDKIITMHVVIDINNFVTVADINRKILATVIIVSQEGVVNRVTLVIKAVLLVGILSLSRVCDS